MLQPLRIAGLLPGMSSWHDPAAMRQQGRITRWKDDQGFGFITPKGGGDQVFVHIKAFTNRQRRPVCAELVSYELASDDKGRIKAARVAFMNDDGLQPAAGNRRTLTFPALFLALLSVTVFTGLLPLMILGIYLVASTVTFVVYARDKAAARGNQQRTSEASLHVLSLVGGWPGAFFAQELLRHKSAKQSFRVGYWITVGLNCVGLAWLASPAGTTAMRSVVDAF